MDEKVEGVVAKAKADQVRFISLQFTDIFGTVKNAAGAGIAGITVSVSDGTEVRSVKTTDAVGTDPAGMYQITDLPPGAYTITFAEGDTGQTPLQTVLKFPVKLSSGQIDEGSGELRQQLFEPQAFLKLLLHSLAFGNVDVRYNRASVPIGKRRHI